MITQVLISINLFKHLSKMKKENLLKYLRNMSEGTKLYTKSHGYVYFLKILESETHPILLRVNNNTEIGNIFLTEFGCISVDENAECMLFPDKNTDWKTWENNKQATPKFNIGDYVVLHEGLLSEGIFKIYDLITNNGKTKYYLSYYNANYNKTTCDKEECLELIHQKDFLKPFDKVLVRNNDTQPWKIGIYERYDDFTNNDSVRNKEDWYPYVLMNKHAKQCIPYEGNKDYLGTTKKYKNE